MPRSLRPTPLRARLHVHALEDRSVPSAAGLVAWWTGDDTGADASGNHHDATPYNGAGYTAAVVNDGFLLDGQDDYLLAADHADFRFTTAFTIEGWIRMDQLPPDGSAATIINKDSQLSGQRSYSFSVLPDGRLYSEVFGDGTDQSAAIRRSIGTVPQGSFAHVALVYDGPNGRHDLYVNGQVTNGAEQLNNGVFPASLFVNAEPVQIGAYRQNYFANSFSRMAIDELRMFDRALSDGDLEAIYLDELPSDENHAPVAVVGGPYAMIDGGSVTLNGSASSDADGDALSYSWAINGHAGAATGATPTLDWATLQAAGITTAGEYAVALTVADGHGGVDTSATTLTVVFDARSLTDLSKALKAGRTIPIRLQLLDAAGNNISSPSIAVTAVRLQRVNADGSRTPVTLDDAGGSNPGGAFRYDASLQGYIFNLSTKNLAAGNYEFLWMAGNDPTEHKLSFALV